MNSRRRFLQTLGLTTGSLFLPSLTRQAAGEDGGSSTDGPPSRLVVFFTTHGTVYDAWKLRPPGVNTDRRWRADLRDMQESEFSPILRPLHPFRDRLTIFDGLALASAELETNQVRHYIGSVHAMTGAHSTVVSSTVVGGAPSIDQIVAREIARTDHFRSLELSVGEPGLPISTRAAGLVLPAHTDPGLVHRQLFGSGDLGRRTALERSMYDELGSWYEDFSGRLSTEDQLRVGVHRDMLRDLELRASTMSDRVCSAPDLVANPLDYGTTYSDYVKLIAASLACDLTRVATVYMSTQPGPRVVPGFGGDIHQEFAHDVFAREDARAAMTEYSTLHSHDFAELLTALDAIPEGDGSVLDNTTVVWLGELGDGGHGYDRWPVIVAGGRGMRRGSYEYWPRTTPFAAYQRDGTWSERMGLPHQHFLVSLAQSFGVSIDEMPITELTGLDGSRISCTGPLDDIMA